MDATLDEEILTKWVGRSATQADTFDAGTARRMQQTLDRDASLIDGDPLPCLWHWLYFVESARRSGLGPDGHPARGGFLPPVALPRRMWAGGRLEFHDRLKVGEAATKRSAIENVTLKSGSSGELCFVQVRHEIEGEGGGRIIEYQDIVYREEPNPDALRVPRKDPPGQPDQVAVIVPDPVMLFRYSALTFNAHRIHYDRPYATGTEGYPGLVFHGPLTATLLAELAVASGGPSLASFSFRGVAPLLDNAPFRICAKTADDGLELWAETPEGDMAMSAHATFTG